VPQQPTLVEQQLGRLRQNLQREEWEAIVGGSWLNKLGVLVLIVGISLFLGYSLTQLGPAGRVAVGLGVSLGLLLVGVVFERKPQFVMFGRGLIGGGWAGTYFTTYAMHGLEAARIIDNPVLATLALAGVATCMIGHSLRYQSQVVTGLAYFIGFATLAIAPATDFSVAATIPLAASLLWVAHRSGWTGMAIVGLVTTYGTYLVARTGTDVGQLSLVREQAVLGIYWLLFESFDVLTLRRARTASPAIMPLNACAFVGVSLVGWESVPPAGEYVFYGVTAAAYVASAIVRALVLRAPAARGASDTNLPDVSYRWSVTAAVVLLVPAILLRFSGTQVNIAFLLVAEMLFLCGIRFGDSYLRWLAALAFALPVAKTLFVDLQVAEHVSAGLVDVLRWTPTALVTAALLYLNRALLGRRNPIEPEWTYRPAATALLAVVVAFEAPAPYLGVGWFLLAAVLFEVSVWRRLPEFRIHAYLVGGAGLVAMLSQDVNSLETLVWSRPAVHAVLAYAWLARLATARPGSIGDSESRLLRGVTSWFGTVFAVVAVGVAAPPAYLGLSWLVVAALLFELSLRTGFVDFRRQSYAVAALATGRLLIEAFPETVQAISMVTGIGGATVLFWLAFTRSLRLTDDQVPETERHSIRDLAALAGTALAGILCWQLLPTPVVAIGWAVMAIVLLDLGSTLSVPSLRTYGHLALWLMMGRLVMANLPSTGMAFGLSHRVLTMVPATALVYFVSSWCKRLGAESAGERTLSRLYLWAGTTLAVLLLGFEFEFERTVTVAGWSVMSLVLLVLGLRWNHDDLRRQGYAVAALTFVRSWTTGFYAPESLAPTVERLTLAAIVIAVFYAAHFLLVDGDRAKDHAAAEDPGTWLSWIDRHAASLFAVAASVLLADVIYNQTSSGLLTVAWGIEGAALLGVGFAGRNRVLRRLGLLLLAVCTVKLFAYDFRELDALARIFSFIVLGALMVATSWVYARYRERLQNYI